MKRISYTTLAQRRGRIDRDAHGSKLICFLRHRLNRIWNDGVWRMTMSKVKILEKLVYEKCTLHAGTRSGGGLDEKRQ